MRLKLVLCFFSALIISSTGFAQEEDLLKNVTDEKPQKEFVFGAFKSSRVIMSHSMEMLHPGVLDFRILHRFGNINQGLSELFGLDQATIRLGLDYGLSRNITIGIGRGTYRKEIDGFLKWRLLHQSTGIKASPISLVAVVGSTIIGAPWADPNRENLFSSRIGYYGQAIIGRKFSESLTFQLMPTLIHRNLVETKADPNDLFATGIGGRLKLTKRISLNIDYYLAWNQNNARDLYNPLSVGFDIETGGHVFQLHFTNAIGMNERAFLTETTNNWGNGDIQFGFNISRAFQIGKRKAATTY